MTEQQLEERTIVRNGLIDLKNRAGCDETMTALITLIEHAFARIEQIEDRQNATLQ